MHYVMLFLLPHLCGSLLAVRGLGQTPPPPAVGGFTGSSECRSCHQDFYARWAPSFHGLAMQPFTTRWAREHLTPQPSPVRIKDHEYRVELNTQEGRMLETDPRGKQDYPIVQVLGGKNVYYFITTLNRGFLQVLPVAYDVRRKEWFDTTLSAMRHFTEVSEEALNWKERPLTFNTGCYKCHVSQLSNHYDLDSDAYHTTWKEPGINCETCHGPGGEHVRTFRAAASEGAKPKALNIISTKQFTHDQINDLCSSCHSKMILLTTTFSPGDRFFDHFDLVAWENPDFHPDGRDLGENYTVTQFRSSACVKDGQLDCLHCHTSSGRNRFTGAQVNHACLPCHADKVSNAPAHSHHSSGSSGNQCVSCHMPTTEFARMRRTDHSMRPPTPAATLAFKSPNACSLCHTNESPQWADQQVRRWWTRDFQAPVLKQAELVTGARRGDWSRLTNILEAIQSPGEKEIYKTSLIRLIRGCERDEVRVVLLGCLKDPSPLIRASSAESLGAQIVPQTVSGLLAATRDDYRLVRVRAAAALAPVSDDLIPITERSFLQRAYTELEAGLLARPDDFLSHYNLGNYYQQRGNPSAAVNSFRAALRLQTNYVPAWINVSLAYNMLQQNNLAEEALRQALQLSPTNAAAHFNLGLLLAELSRFEEAEAGFRAAIKFEPRSAQAAYNLGVLLAAKSHGESINWCRKAAEWQPDEPKYAYTLAFYLQQNGDRSRAIQWLQSFVKRPAADASIFDLLGKLLETSNPAEAAQVYRNAAANERLSASDRQMFTIRAGNLLNK